MKYLHFVLKYIKYQHNPKKIGNVYRFGVLSKGLWDSIFLQFNRNCVFFLIQKINYEVFSFAPDFYENNQHKKSIIH